MGNIDFTDCRRVFGKAYNGATDKSFSVHFIRPISRQDGRNSCCLLMNWQQKNHDINFSTAFTNLNTSSGGSRAYISP